MEVEESVASTVSEGEILGIQFLLASHCEIRTSSISDCPISHASQLSNPFLGLPLETGRCESCGTAEPGKCEGHFGYIELPIPVYHPSHVSELKRMLNLICLKCLKMKTSKFPVKNNGVMERLLSACCEEACQVSIKENKNSDGASFLELKVPGRSRHDGSWEFLDRYGYRYGDGSSRTLLASEVSVMLKKLPQDSRKKLAKKGYFPQEGYIVRCLPVPPNCLSVPDISDGVSVMSSDLCSVMLRKVLRQIEIIRSSRSGEPNFESHEVEANDLQIAVSQYLQVRGTGKAARDRDNRYGVSKDGNSSSTKAWLEKMRTLFISKGSGHSSRSVITGDAYKPVNEVGIPSEIAQKMTFEERVNVHNVQYLQSLVDQNLCLTFRDGLATYSLREGSKGHTFLRIGQVVHRRIMDGDIVFINRPPTTHKHSLQALRVYIHDDHVVKINPLMCGPLAADFDGDCVHLFYPQSLSARAEVLELFSVDKQLLSSHSGNLNLQLAADALLSLKTIFKVHFLDKASAQQLAMHTSAPLPSPAVRKGCSSGPCWTAQQVLQIALPPLLECRGEKFYIHGGEMVKLDFSRDTIASVMNELLTSVFFSKSPKEALNFLDSLQPLLMENIFAEGFSVGLNDFFVLSSELENLQNQIQDLISPVLLQLRSSFNELVQLQFESYIKLLKLPVSNFILKSSAIGNLIDSRSDSAIDKVVQQIGFLGLQLSDRRKFYSRSLVEEIAALFKTKYPLGSLYPSEEFGLVRSCFFRGLDAYQEIVHSIATREVIVRSSKGLAEPGTLFKNLMAVLRDVVICYDGSVRNVSSNSVIQFEYGLGGVPSQSLFPAGEPVGVLAATAMSNPAYKAVLDSSPSSNSSWDMMKEILFCRVNFKNEMNDRRVILYLNNCGCGRKYCQENASFLVKNHLRKVSLRDAAIEFLIEYKRPKFEPGSADTDTGLVGHIHLNAALLKESNISMADVQEKCEEQFQNLRKKKKYAFLRRVLVSVSECCSFSHSGSRWSMPCLKFFWQDLADPHLERISHVMADLICPVLLDTIIKGDPRISTVNIVWISPGTISWVESPGSDTKGELGVEVTLEKTAVRQSGDAWRTVMDCCLPVFHLIDTRRSIPYAIKQIQDLLGISCAFDQAVQRLSTSVTLVTRGVLKEHLILLANSMTCSGNLIGFNMSGIKALCRALNVQVPFTEATLYTPRKCFERASEKRHVDSLTGIVASCSWGKRVAVGTGAKFDVLWDTKEIEKDEKPIDVYNFLHMVRSSTEEEIDSGCLGVDIEKFDLEDEYMEPAMSPDQENKAVFEDPVDLDPQEEGGGGSSWDALPSSGKGWDSGNGSSEGSGWGGWGQAKPKDSSGSGGWGSSSKEEGNDKHCDNGQEETAWGQPSADQKSQDANWRQPSSGGWNSKKATEQAALGGWETKKQEDTRQSSWGASAKPKGNNQHSDNGQEEDGWGQPSTGSLKQKSPEAKWGQSSAGWNSNKFSEQAATGGWDNKKQEDARQPSWGASSKGKGIDQGSDNGLEDSAWGKPNTAPLKQKSPVGNWGQPLVNESGETPWKKNDNESGGWKSAKVNQQTGHGSWGSEKKESNAKPQQSVSAWNNNREAVSGTWGAQKRENQTESSWEHQKDTGGGAAGWSSNKAFKESGSKSWDSEKNKNGQTSWGQTGGSSWKNSLQKKENQEHSSWEHQKSSGGGADGLSSDKVPKESGSKSWDLEKDNNRKSQSSWGQAGGSSWKNSSQKKENQPHSSWEHQSSGGGADGWSSDKAPKESGSKSWDLEKDNRKSQSSWGPPGDSTWKSPSQNAVANQESGTSWDFKKNERKSQPSWGQPRDSTNNSSQNAVAWGSANQESGTSWDSNNSKASWGQLNDSTCKDSAQNSDGWGSDKSPKPGVSSSAGWELGKEVKTHSPWGQKKESTDKLSSQNMNGASKSVDWDSGKSTESGGFSGGELKIDDNGSQSSWAKSSDSKSPKQNADAWGAAKSNQHGSSSGWGSGSLDKAPGADGSKTWEAKSDERKAQSSWGQPSESAWKSSPSADGWDSNKLSQSGNSSGWGSGKASTGKDDNKNDAWGKPTSGEWKKRPEGGRGWGSSNSGEWKNRKNRPPKQPGVPNEDFGNVALTATRKRMDIFPAEEQDVLSEVESIMQSIRKIMHQSGCNDGEPLPSDDQTYIINNVLNHHPDKAAKMGSGIDFITVKKHSNFQESRCFYVVCTDGQSQDFSYIKCVENFIKGKYPSTAESFISKYMRKRQGGNRQQGQQEQQDSHQGQQEQ